MKRCLINSRVSNQFESLKLAQINRRERGIMRIPFCLLMSLLAIGHLPMYAGIQINYLNDPTLPIVKYGSGLTVVPDGNQVRMGYFTVSPGGSVVAESTIQSIAGDLGALRALTWNGGSTTIASGFFSDNIYGDYESIQLYMWAFKTSDNGAPFSGSNTVDYYGLYSSIKWTFSSSITPFDAPTSDIGLKYYGDFSQAGGYLQLAAVPEPSAYALVMGSGALLFAVMRKLKARS